MIPLWNLPQRTPSKQRVWPEGMLEATAAADQGPQGQGLTPGGPHPCSPLSACLPPGLSSLCWASSPPIPSSLCPSSEAGRGLGGQWVWNNCYMDGLRTHSKESLCLSQGWKDHPFFSEGLLCFCHSPSWTFVWWASWCWPQRRPDWVLWGERNKAYL